MWLVLSFFLQGVFGALLMQLATPPRPALQWLGAMLFVRSPAHHPIRPPRTHGALAAAGGFMARAEGRCSTGVAGTRVGLGRSRRDDCRRAALPAADGAPTIAGAVSLRQCLAAPRQVLAIALHGTLVLAAVWMALWQSGSLDGAGCGLAPPYRRVRRLLRQPADLHPRRRRARRCWPPASSVMPVRRITRATRIWARACCCLAPSSPGRWSPRHARPRGGRRRGRICRSWRGSWSWQRWPSARW